MNKLLQLKQAWIKENEDYLLGWGLSMKVIELIEDDIVKNAVEYAQHVTRIGSSDPLWTEFQACRYAFEKRIEQDLQSLNTK